eukprot:16438708-Heterocapsa_arctica.AAC.2
MPLRRKRAKRGLSLVCITSRISWTVTPNSKKRRAMTKLSTEMEESSLRIKPKASAWCRRAAEQSFEI